METEEISDRYVVPCFVNGLEVYDDEINLGKEENMISNEFAVKLCLDHEIWRSEKIDDDWDLLLDDLDFGDIPEIKRAERPVIETMTYSDKYKKLLNDICLDTMKLEGEMKKEEEEAIIKVKQDALIKKEDPEAFVIPIRLEAKIKLNALVDTGSDINVMPYRVYKQLGREELKNVNRGITMLNIQRQSLWGFLRMFCASLNTKESDNDDEEDYGIQNQNQNRLNWNVLNQMACGEEIDEMFTIKLCVASTNEEIFTSEAWTNDFNINEPIYSELFHEFYSTYEFGKVCVDDELRTKKIIKFRLCGRTFSWMLLEFAKRLGLYHSHEIKEEGFDVYFQGGLLRDEHFNAREYWWMKRKGACSQKGSMICYGQLITKISKRKNFLSKEVLNSLSASIYYRDLDTTTLKELIDSEGRLYLEVPKPGVPRVAIPRPPRASMLDIYERMGSIEICQGTIKRLAYRQSYHWDMYVEQQPGDDDELCRDDTSWLCDRMFWVTYVVPTGRVIVPAGSYIVPTGSIIVTADRYIVPVGSDHDSDNASIHNEAPNNHQQQNIQPQIITTVTNNNAKFPYLKKDEYERESKARTTLLQYIPYDHISDFHYLDDARDIWNAVKARFGGNAESKKMRKTMLKQEFLKFRISEAEGVHKGYDMMQKIWSQLNQLNAKPDAKEINLRFLRALPSSWFQVALTLKTKGGLEFLSFDDLYYKLKTLEMDIKGYNTFSQSQSASPSHTAFVSTTSTNKKLSYGDCSNHSSITTYTVSSNSKIGSHRTGNVIEDVLYSFVPDTEPEQQLAYEDLEQIDKLDLEEMDLKWQMAMLSVRVHKFRQKAGRKIDFDKKESARAKGGNDKKRYSSFKNQEIGIKEEDLKALVSVDTLVDWSNHENESDEVIAAKEFGMMAGANSVEPTLQMMLNNLLSWESLLRLIDSSMSVRAKVGLGFTACISQKELRWDDSAFSVFTTTSEDVEGIPTFHRFATTDSMKVVPPPLTGDYTSLSYHPDLDESQMSYGTKSSTSNDPESVTNDFVSCDDNDKSSEDNTSDFASCGIGARPQPVPTGTPMVKLVPTGRAKVNSVPTGQPKVKPVPTGRAKVNSVPTAKPKETSFLATKNEGIFDSGCSRSTTGNKDHLDDFQAFYGGKVTFGGGEGRITGKRTIRRPTLDFENVFYVKELQQFNLFSISQICDKKNQVLFTDTECLVLSNDFKFPDYSMVVLTIPRKHNLYTIKLNDLCPRGNLACLVAHASFDECVKWHRFCWVFFLEHKDETYSTFKSFLNLVENQLNKKVKAIRCDNGTEFKNAQMIKLCGAKGIRREYSKIRTPQQNGVAERKNITLIEASRTKVSITNPHNKTPYALLTGKIPTVSHFKPFGCHVTILSTSNHLGKSDGKADEGYLLGYSTSNKAYRVYNVLTKRVEETMNLYFLEDKPNIQGLGYAWYFDLDYLTDSLGYKHVLANQSTCIQGNTTTSAGTQDADSDSDCDEQVIIIPSYPSHIIQGTQPVNSPGDKEKQVTTNAEELRTPSGVEDVLPSCIPIPTGSLPVATGSVPVPAGDTTVPTDDVPVHTGNTTDSLFDDQPTTRFPCPSDLGNHDPLPGIFSSSSYDDEFDTALNNVDSSVQVSSVPTKRIHTIHPQSLIIRDHTFVVQTRSMVKQNPTAKALADPSWVDAMQEEMQQFKFQNVWVLVGLPPGKYAIGTKWILKNKRDAREIMVRNKARLVAQGHGQEEGINYDEVFAPVARIEAIRLFLAFASYTGFLVYQMDVKSLQGSQSSIWSSSSSKSLGEFQMSAMGELTFFLSLQVQQKPDGIFIHQEKYVQDILHKFDLGNVRTATTPYEAQKPKPKSESNCPINVHLYRFMIGSLMYLTTLRSDIMFAVSACLRHQITPTASNLEAVKKIFKYLKGQPKLGLWYPKESPLVLEAYSDSDYAAAKSDRKSTTGGCQFLGRRLILWQCKKQTIVATSSTEAEYVAAANCCGQYQPSLKIIHQHKLSTILQQSSMAALKYKEEHNKVGYVLKPTGSDDYHQIIDFLSASHIRAPESGPPAILATIDNTPDTISEVLVRSRLQLADDGCVTDIPITEIYSRMDALGYVTKGIETRVTKQYKVLVFSSKLFANMRINFAGNPMPLLPTMLLQAAAGGGAEVAAQDVPHLVPAPDQSTPQLTTPSRPPSLDPVAPVLEHDHRGVEDPITLTALSSVVSTLVQKVHSLEAELKDHKQLFKNVVGKLVKKVKSLKVKLKTKKRKMVVSDSDEEEGTKPIMNLEALRALANAAVANDSDAATDVPAAISLTPPGASGVALGASTVAPGASTGATGTSGVATGTSGVATGTTEAATGTTGVATGTTGVGGAVASASGVGAGPFRVAPGDFNVSPGGSVTPTVDLAVSADSPQVPPGASNKRKSPMIEEDIPVPARTFRQIERRSIGQQEVLDSAKFYTADDWLNIQAQVKANASLSKTLLGDDVFEDNFPARMAALIKKKRQALAEQSFKERQNRPLTPAQQKAYMRHITFKRLGSVLEEPPTKKPKCPEEPIPSMPEIPIPHVVTSPPFSRTQRKFIARKPMIKPKSKLPTLDLDATTQTFLKVIVDDDSDDEEYVDEVWFAVVGWELISTPLGEVNAIYRIDGTTKHFTTLRQILHLVDCQGLMREIFKFYLIHKLVERDLLFGKINIDRKFKVGELASPKKTATGKDISNPFMAVLICQKSLGYFNSPMIQVLRVGLVINPPGYVVPTGRVIVPAGRYIVPTGSIIVTADRVAEVLIVGYEHVVMNCGSARNRYVVPTGRVIVPAGRYIVPTGSIIVTADRLFTTLYRQKDLLEWDLTISLQSAISRGRSSEERE
nr:hypothetical protein [Tanacetum cinerariifolium]